VLPKLFAKKFLGVDIGTSSIRVVELERNGPRPKLSNYGEIELDQIETDIPKEPGKAVAVFSAQEIAEMITAVLDNAKIKTKQCAFSIPDFSTFFTSFTLPPMTKKELPEAVLFEARQHIPLPIESVTIDWQLASEGADLSQKAEITVAAIPNEVISRYREIAAAAKLEITLMEAEMFGLLQALIPEGDMTPTCLIDIGAQSTVCSLVENRVLRYSHSFDRGGNYLVEELARRLPVSPEHARNIREVYGLKFISLADPGIKGRVANILRESLLPVLREIELMFDNYRRISNSEISRIVISGGTVAVPEIQEQFAAYFKKSIDIAAPFDLLEYPARIEAELKEIGPTFAVAVGMAERGLKFVKSK